MCVYLFVWSKGHSVSFILIEINIIVVRDPFINEKLL